MGINSVAKGLNYSIAFKIEVMNYAGKHGKCAAEKAFWLTSYRLAIEMSITEFAGTTLWHDRFMRRNGLCMCTKTTIVQKLPR